jgi:hypothetical protein
LEDAWPEKNQPLAAECGVCTLVGGCRRRACKHTVLGGGDCLMWRCVPPSKLAAWVCKMVWIILFQVLLGRRAGRHFLRFHVC